MPDAKRIMKELQECKIDSDTSGVQAWTLDGDIVKWRGQVQGPPDTPYAGGVFMIDIQLPDAYPFEPPKMKFITKVWHPNISSQTGAICLDILKNEWSPALTIKTTLVSIQALLCAPEPSSPQDAVVAEMYVKNRAQYIAEATAWTKKYATEGGADAESVAKLTEMGFSAADARAALAKTDGNVERAIEILFG